MHQIHKYIGYMCSTEYTRYIVSSSAYISHICLIRYAVSPVMPVTSVISSVSSVSSYFRRLHNGGLIPSLPRSITSIRSIGLIGRIRCHIHFICTCIPQVLSVIFVTSSAPIKSDACNSCNPFKGWWETDVIRMYVWYVCTQSMCVCM